MKYSDKETIAVYISCLVFAIVAASGWFSDETIMYIGIAWLVTACVVGLRGWYLQCKDEI